MKIAPSIKRFGLGAVAALVLTSCLSEMPRPFPTQPDLPAFIPSFTPIVTTPSTILSVQGKSNRIKYSNKGAQPASITAGGVTLRMRALLAKTGATTIEATTGVFEGTPGVHVIQKTQLRVLSAPEAEPIQAWPTAPVWAYNMMGLVRGDQLYLQATVKPSGMSKTEVMRISDTVRLRPDLRVNSIDAAATALVDMPVMIYATVSESNGDVGARANCVLSVNGVAADQATGIWVDAADVVSCQFAYVFKEQGTYTVAVSASDVAPADWDDANNSASRQITVVTPGTPVDTGDITVLDEASDDVFTQTREGPYPIQMVNGTTRRMSSVFVVAKAFMAYPEPIQRVEAEFLAGSRVVHQATITSFVTFNFVSNGAQGTCARHTGDFLDAMSCTVKYPNGSTHTEMSYEHSTGTVTFYGNALWCNLSGCNTFGGPWSNSQTFDNGQPYGLLAGDQLQVKLKYVDATGNSPLLIDRFVPMVDASGDVNWEWSFCDENQYEGLGTVCMGQKQTGTKLSGRLRWRELTP